MTAVATPIAAQFGWRAVFHCTGCCCAALLCVWVLLAASRPVDGRMPAEELRLLVKAGVVKIGKKPPKPLRLLPPTSILGQGCVWCVVPDCKSGHQLVRVGWGWCP